jgi:ABC-type nitrate/sulfonate/bicarbonate transport system permease component
VATASVVNRQPHTRGFTDVVKQILHNRLWGIVSLAAVLVLWWAVVEIFKPQELLFPGPGAVIREFGAAYQDGLVWPAVSSSLYAVAVGLALALLVGVPAGLFIGMSPTADLLTSPYLWGFFAMPRIAMAPLMVLWFGFGDTTKIWLVFLSAVVPIILNCKEGVQTIDESLLRAAKSFGANRLDTFRKVVAPATVPSIATGVRNGISRGFVGLLVIELTVGSGGIGTQVMRSMRLFNTGRMFAFAILLVVIALVLISISRRVEIYANRWREEVAI